MDTTPEAEVTLPALVRDVGPWALLALVCGIAVAVLAVRVARRGGPSRHALALFAASWLAFPPLVSASTESLLCTYVGYTMRWRDPEARALIPFVTRPDPARPARDVVCAAGLFLGLAGSVAALARSRPGPLPRTD